MTKRCDFWSLGVPGPASTPLGPGPGSRLDPEGVSALFFLIALKLLIVSTFFLLDGLDPIDNFPSAL